MTKPASVDYTASILDDLRWFVRLRWLAAAVLCLGALVNAAMQEYTAVHTRVLIVVAAIALYNLPLWWLQQPRRSAAIPPRWRPLITSAQLGLDLVALTLLTTWTGGLTSPLLGLFVIHVVFASLLLPPPSAYFVVAAVLALVAAALALTDRWPRDHDERMIALGWMLLLLLTSYVCGRIVRSLRRHERDLETQSRRTAAILETAADGIITIDDRGIILSANPAAEAIFGYRVEEMIGRNVAMLASEPYSAEHDGYLERYLRTGEARIIGIGRLVEGRRRDGSVFPIDLAVSEVRLEGERMFTGIVRDISDRVEAEEELRQLNTELKRQQQAMVQHEKMAAMGQLAAGVAHEIANPLASLDSLLQLVSRHPQRLNEATGQQLRDQVTRIGSIVRQMSDFAHPHDSAWETKPLNEVIDTGLDMLRYDRRARDVEIVRNFASNGGTVRLMPLAIQQVVLNLVINALDAVADVDQPRIEIRTRREGSWCVVEVADNGPGIPPERLDRVFEPFFTTKPPGKGTGLGLSITYSLVDRHGGRCRVESTVGTGTTFSVRLPVSGDRSRRREQADDPDS